MRILILDDSDSRLITFREKLQGAAVTCTKHVKECINLLNYDGPWDYVFLDHDLEGKVYVPSGPGTGYEVAEWLNKNYNKKPKNIIIHTCNEKAAPLMIDLLPEAIWLSGLFLIDFDISDLDNIEDFYHKFININFNGI